MEKKEEVTGFLSIPDDLTKEELDEFVKVWNKTLDEIRGDPNYEHPKIVKLKKNNDAKTLELLAEWLKINDTECRFDHHGYCQEHYLGTDCIVLRTRKLLQEIKTD